MPSEIDIYRSAAVLVREHGKSAEREALQRANSMSAKGDADGHAVWLRIVRAVEEIQRKKRAPGGAAH